MVLQVHECVCLVVFRGAAYLHETLQLPWLGDKRPDYSSWHPLDRCCLNIVHPKSDPELLPFICLSSFSTSSPLPLSCVCSLPSRS